MSKILVLNAGSSSLKYALFEGRKSTIKGVLSSGIISRIGEQQPMVKHEDIAKNNEITVIKKNLDDVTNYYDALQSAISLMSKNGNLAIDAVGHRVVHGGEKMTKCSVINAEVIESIKEAIPLAPLHNPHNLMGIETAMKLFQADVLHVAAFDTSFHSTLPDYSYLYGVPYDYYKKYGIRKYGFHGISHEYVMKVAAKYLEKPADSLNLITCHLGAGSSICCIKDGVSVDTTMGMTPLEGLIMATRCGDIDANVIFYLMERMKLSPDECKHILQNESGWLGLSGMKDAMELQNAFQKKEELSEVVVSSIVHRIQRYLGAYYWYLEGNVDAVIFTAGVGENWPYLRKASLDKAKNLGFVLDDKKNEKAFRRDHISEICSERSKHKILVIPTNEELNIAEKTLQLLGTKRSNRP